jgi:hypothetical protein
MNTQEAKKLQTQTANSSSSNHAGFDFELWAKEVRPQLLAALQKKGK